MADYSKEQGLQSICNAALGRYHSKGFRLVEPDDHILVLYYLDELVARFSQVGATIPAIRETCQEYMERVEAS